MPDPKSELPRNVAEMQARIGVIHGVNGVRNAMDTLGGWVVDLAEHTWPTLFYALPETDRYTAAWDLAKMRWPGVDDYAEALNVLERDCLRAMGPTA